MGIILIFVGNLEELVRGRGKAEVSALLLCIQPLFALCLGLQMFIMILFIRNTKANS